MKNLTSLHIVTALALTVVMPNMTFAQLEPLPSKGIEVRVILRTSSVCSGSSAVPGEVIVVNRTDSPVTLDVSGFTMAFGYVALIDTGNMKRRLEGLAVQQDLMGPRKSKTQVLLQPREAYVSGFDFPLKGPFFKANGFYRLNVSSSLPVNSESKTETVSASNDAVFEIKSCSE
jgi:hypothetical protein